MSKIAFRSRKDGSHYPISRGSPRRVDGRVVVSRRVVPLYENQPVMGAWCTHDNVIKQDHCGKCGKESFKTSHEPREYTVEATYAGGETEAVKTVAHSPEEALHFGLMKAENRQERPVEVNVKNGLGDIVGKLGGKIKEKVHTKLEERRQYNEEINKIKREERLKLEKAKYKAKLESDLARAKYEGKLGRIGRITYRAGRITGTPQRTGKRIRKGYTTQRRIYRQAYT